MQLMEIASRMDREQAKAKMKRESRKPKNSLAEEEKSARLKRIMKERKGIEPTMRRAFDKIDEFRSDIKEFKNMTIEMSKQYIIDLENAAKKDRVAWMQEKERQ